jgi:uncharacterized phage-associated protein
VSYPSQRIANTFLDIAKSAGVTLTNMQVQKLVYFAHGFYLALKDEPLIEDEIKAWNFGPVIPPLYNDLKQYSNGIVTSLISGFESIPDGFDKSFIQKVFDLYGRISGPRLSAATHMPNSPWDKVYKKSKFSAIPNELMKEHFKTKLRPSAVAA